VCFCLTKQVKSPERRDRLCSERQDRPKGWIAEHTNKPTHHHLNIHRVSTLTHQQTNIQHTTPNICTSTYTIRQHGNTATTHPTRQHKHTEDWLCVSRNAPTHRIPPTSHQRTNTQHTHQTADTPQSDTATLQRTTCTPTPPMHRYI
jgi:hypothetical protein